ncbi:hypothetical protein PB2503_11379 [Parvularcula bermudensis HTCC2503]|uniref:Alpha-2-macroglobulin family protein n=1 Tax=Parvularcula bermudensis (strain ATCC BAA-594 / HTCC2503 / KCTC 12087) TaxID=314260 RepID=E0TCG7_PARBH|nr:alpha-2-macroglobulin [Parvularcula bermudensis]ADM10323.1 hypothetical protein PB2503_11379 [Parvularcula bermudensis HTCC2503]
MSIRSTGLIFLLVSLLVLGCDDRKGPPPPTTTTDLTEEQRPEPPRSDADPASADDTFALLRSTVSLDSPVPEICLIFSHPLDPQADYQPYLDLDLNVALKVEGQRLCLGGLRYGEETPLTLRRGLPGAAGRELAADTQVTLSFEDRPPLVDFAGDGMILPRIDADGLALRTVNVDKVEVVIERVTDRALVFQSLGAGFRANEGAYGYAPNDPGDRAIPIYSGRVEIDADRNAEAITVFPIAEAIGELEPGAYFVRLADAEAIDRDVDRPSRAARWLLVTDLAFTAYRSGEGLTTTIRSLNTARPVADVEITLVAASNERLATRTSDDAGQVQFAAPLLAGQAGNAPRFLMAYGPDGDFAALDLNRSPVDLSDNPIEGRRPPNGLDGFLALDRGIYRPGETVYSTLIVRTAAARAAEGRPGILQLVQPNGMVVEDRRFSDLAEAGGLSAAFALPDRAARGQWRLTATLDGAGQVAAARFAVEDFVPQRIALTIDSDQSSPLTEGETRPITAEIRFLYGAPGAGLPVGGRARLVKDPSPFPDFSDFRFGVSTETFRERQFPLPSTTADETGVAQLPLSAPEAEQSSFPLRLRAVVEASEPGGRPVAEDLFIPFRPRPVYLGMRPAQEGTIPRQEPFAWSLLAVDRTGQQTALPQVQWQLDRRDVDYDWYKPQGGDWQWRRTERSVPIETGQTSLNAETETVLSLPALDWGDYTLTVRHDGEALAAQSFFVGYGGRTGPDNQAPDQVRLLLPDDPPTPGETIEVGLDAPYPGIAEITVATDKVLATYQLDVPEGGAEISLPTDERWAGGAYVLATVYTPRDRQDQPLPRRAVGVGYVATDMSARTYEVALDAPDRVAPNQSLPIDLRLQGGPRRERAFATVAAVDEGILQLTKFETPDPVAHFYGKEQLGIDLLDDYGRLLDPNQGRAAALRSGGDQIGGAGLTVVPTKTVALFSGPIDIGTDGRARISLDLPDFNGELRLMAIVWSETGLGAGSRPLTVRDDVPVEAILPRFLAPGDRAVATLSADNISGAEGVYGTRIETEGPLTISNPSGTVTLSRGDRADRPFTLEAAAPGIGHLSVDMQGPDGARYGSRFPLEVRSAFLPETRIRRFTLTPGESLTLDSSLDEGLETASVSAHISVSATPIDAAALFSSLRHYRYQCTEQLVSQTMPLLDAAVLGTEDDRPEGATADIRTAIETLLARQSANGAFGLWRVGDQDASPWIGAYATEFLWRAQKAGYQVPDMALNRAVDALRPYADGRFYAGGGYDVGVAPPKYTDDTPQRLQHRSAAYALYVLAMQGSVDRSRLRYMHDQILDEIESPLAKAHLGAGLHLIGDRGRAMSAFTAANDSLGYRNQGDWYQTPLRDRAGVLALASDAGLVERAEEMADLLATDIPPPADLTTQEKAFLIRAAGAMATAGEAADAATLDGRPFDGASPLSASQLDDAPIVRNAGDGLLYGTLLVEGAPLTPPQAVGSGLSLTKRLYTESGSSIDASSFTQGQRAIILLTLTPERAAEASYIVEDLLPAGFEIETVLDVQDSLKEGVYAFLPDLVRPDIAEKRDDRFVSALTVSSKTPRHLAYLVRAVTPGDFTAPGAVAEDMYRPDIFARSASGTISIEAAP